MLIYQKQLSLRTYPRAGVVDILFQSLVMFRLGLVFIRYHSVSSVRPRDAPTYRQPMLKCGLTAVTTYHACILGLKKIRGFVEALQKVPHFHISLARELRALPRSTHTHLHSPTEQRQTSKTRWQVKLTKTVKLW